MARPKYPSDEQEQFMVRMPSGMRHRIKERASTNNRSMNAEIVSLLEDAFINESYSETMEKLAVERQLQSKTSVEQRLSDIEAKLERILARLDK